MKPSCKNISILTLLFMLIVVGIVDPIVTDTVQKKYCGTSFSFIWGPREHGQMGTISNGEHLQFDIFIHQEGATIFGSRYPTWLPFTKIKFNNNNEGIMETKTIGGVTFRSFYRWRSIGPMYICSPRNESDWDKNKVIK